jgi:hypothetical protein
MSLIQEISITDFKKLKPEQIRELKSVSITSNGEYLFTAVIPPVNAGMSITDTIKTEAEHLAYRGNTVGGKTYEEVTNAPLLV